ncbi:autotransporter outer membrane beta-barrel domain-containing protein, partial [Acinetobacter baumannii]
MAQLGVSTGLSIAGTGGLIWRPELRLAWGHDFKDPAVATASAILGQSFAAQDARQGRDAALIGLQLAANRS